MAKKHVHRWVGMVGDATYGAACGGHRPFDPSKKCHARLTWYQIERHLNQRRPKYRRVGTFDTLTDDRKAYMMVQDEYLYVKVSKWQNRGKE